MAMTKEERNKELHDYAMQLLQGWTEDNEDGLTYDEYQEALEAGVYSVEKYINKQNDQETVVSLCVAWGGPYAYFDFVFTGTDRHVYCDINNLSRVYLYTNMIDYPHQPGQWGGMQDYEYTKDESRWLYEEYEIFFDPEVIEDDSEEAVNG